MSCSVGKSALKVLLGLVFIVSAVLKVVGMDNFEIYVYSFHFFNFNVSCLAARAAVIAELVLGLGLVSHCMHKLMWWGSMAMLVAYTLLLIYALTLGREDSCHCFGDMLPLNPKQSLIKNAVLLLLFLPIRKMKSWEPRLRWLFLALAFVVSCVLVFVASPPDSFTTSSNLEQNLNVEVFNAMLDDAPLDSLQLRNGKQVVCFFSTGCEYCRMAARKLSLMQQLYGFPTDSVTCLFVDTGKGILPFYEQSESERYRYVVYPDVSRLLNAVSGNLPVIVLMEDGKVTREFGFRNMDEETIKAFFVQ